MSISTATALELKVLAPFAFMEDDMAGDSDDAEPTDLDLDEDEEEAEEKEEDVE